MGVIFSIVGNGLGLFAAQRYIEGFVFTGGFLNYAAAGLFLAFLNFTLKPIIKIITAPLILLTLGLFIIIINALLLWLTDFIFDFMAIETLGALVLSTILIGIINLIVGAVYKIVD